MYLQMFPVESGSGRQIGSFLLRPTLGVAAYAFVYSADDRTMSARPFLQLAQRFLDYLELGFAPSITGTPSLAKYELPPVARFTASRFVASLRLAKERLPHELGELNLSNTPIIAAVAAIHFDDAGAHLVTAGAPVEMWRLRRDELTLLHSRRGDRAKNEADLDPRAEDLALEDGDIIGLGLLPAPDAAVGAAAAGAPVDVLLAHLVRLAESSGLNGVLCRWSAS
ncbi:MAG: hypothetical protein ABI461_17185 [Polyangiaceae bacterium]